jgi:WD40 repeat protein
VRVGLAIIFSNLILVLGLTLLSPKIFAAPNACAQVFAMHVGESIQHKSNMVNPYATNTPHNQVVVELAQFAISIQQTSAEGHAAEARVLRAQLNKRYKLAEADGVDLSAFGELIKEFSSAIRTQDEVKTQQVKVRKQTKEKEWHLLPWMTSTTFTGHTDSINSAAFSPDGSRIVIASYDGTATIWDARSGVLIKTLNGHHDWVQSAAFSPDGSRIVTASKDKTAKIWDANTGGLIITLAGHTEQVFSAEFSPDGSRIVTSSEDNTAKIWDESTGKQIATLAGHPLSVNSAAFSPIIPRIATAPESKIRRIWTAVKKYANLSQPVTLSSNALYIVTASRDKTAKVWDASTGKQIATLTGHIGWIFSAAFSPDGMRVVTAADDHTARIWDTSTGKLISTLVGHTDWVRSAAFSPDGSQIITAAEDNSVIIWDANTGNPITTLNGHTGIARSALFSPDGSQIITSSWDNTARIWAKIETELAEPTAAQQTPSF